MGLPVVARNPLSRLTLAALAGICWSEQQAQAGNEANFVLYDHHTEAKGTTEINLWSDFSRGAPGDPSYAAQLLEMERAITDQWMAAVYFEGTRSQATTTASAAGGSRAAIACSPTALFSIPCSTSSTPTCAPITAICSRS